jgi:hypothetical protein
VLIIDRFEGDFAVCEVENGETVNIPRTELPLSADEGDCLITVAKGVYAIDADETARRKKRIREKMSRLFSD